MVRFWVRLNPIPSRRTWRCLQLIQYPKKDSIERRVIVDVSFPEFGSVNDGISKDMYLGESVSVNYPTVDELIKLIKHKGKGCKIFKRDLKRAYRQLNVDPGDIHLLGYNWKGYIYFDKILAMGLRSAAYICMRTTNAIKFICKKKWYKYFKLS